MAEGMLSNAPDIEDDSSVNYESAEETLPQHDLDTSSTLKIICSKRVDTTESDLPKSPLITAGNVNSSDSNSVNEKVQEDKLIKDNKKEEMSPGKKKLYSWLNKQMKIEMTDGRVLVGIFLCTDRDANVILGSCTEYLNPEVCGFSDEPRILGLVMVPGRHIVSIHHDASDAQLIMMPEEKEGICGSHLITRIKVITAPLFIINLEELVFDLIKKVFSLSRIEVRKANPWTSRGIEQ